MDRNSPEYEICACRHISRAEAIKIIQKDNITDLVSLCAKGMGDKCGACREDLEALIQETCLSWANNC